MVIPSITTEIPISLSTAFNVDFSCPQVSADYRSHQGAVRTDLQVGQSAFRKISDTGCSMSFMVRMLECSSHFQPLRNLELLFH